MLPASDLLLSRGLGEISMAKAHDTKNRCSRHLGQPNET